MKVAQIDTSNAFVAIVIGEESVLNQLNNGLKKGLARHLHMREMKHNEKLRAVKALAICALSLKQENKNLDMRCFTNGLKKAGFWARIANINVQRVYIDIQVHTMMKLTIGYEEARRLAVVDKEKIVGADVLAWANLNEKKLGYVHPLYQKLLTAGILKPYWKGLTWRLY